MKIISFFTIILFVFILFQVHKTKEARMFGVRTKKEDDFCGYYMFIAFIVFGMVFLVLYFFDFI
jgi:hypothetical protein